MEPENDYRTMKEVPIELKMTPRRVVDRLREAADEVEHRERIKTEVEPSETWVGKLYTELLSKFLEKMKEEPLELMVVVNTEKKPGMNDKLHRAVAERLGKEGLEVTTDALMSSSVVFYTFKWTRKDPEIRKQVKAKSLWKRTTTWGIKHHPFPLITLITIVVGLVSFLLS